MALLLIVADDLTGAADAAAHCYAAGATAWVATGRAPPPLALNECEVLAFHSATREFPAADAWQRVSVVAQGWVQAAGQQGLQPDEIHCFKKIDSMLRGNVAAEVHALCAVLGRSVAVLTSALPHLERVVVDGVAQGPGMAPIVVERLLASEGLTLRATLSDVRTPDALRALVERAAARGSPAQPVILLCDAVEAVDLDAIASAVADHPARPLLCGSGALAASLARAGGHARGNPSPEPARWAGERVLLLLGSRSDRARAQVRAASDAGVRHFRVGVDQGSPPAVHPLILTPPDVDTETDVDGIPIAWTRQLAATAAPLVQSGAYSRLVVGGGATAEALFGALDRGDEGLLLEVVALADVGMPLLRSRGTGALSGWSMVLKPGNHGDETLLTRWLCDDGRD